MTIIQNVPERDVSHLLAVIPDAIIVQDKNRSPVLAFIRCLIKSENKAFLYLQDDVDLCTDFVSKTKIAIAQYPVALISFFTLKKRMKISFENGANYCMSQCVYFPKGLANEIIAFYNEGWPRETLHPTSFDFLIGDFLKASNRKYVLWHPSLVQHQVVRSAIDPSRSQMRQTKSFSDDICL